MSTNGRRGVSPKIIIALVIYVPMLLLALLINTVSGGGAIFVTIPPFGTAALQVAVASLVAVAIILPGPWMSRRFAWAGALEREFKLALGTLTGTEIFALAFLSSVAEEAFYRGALQALFVRLTGGSVVAGVLIASALFAVTHPPFKNERDGWRFKRELVPWMPFAFVLGILLGILYAWEPSNILAPIATHFVNNFVNLHRINRLPAHDDAARPGEMAADAEPEAAGEVFDIGGRIHPGESAVGSDEDEMAARSDD